MIKILRHFEHFCEKKRLNLFWTLYLNMRLLPFKQALYFPILCYGSIRVRSAEGKMLLPPQLVRKGILKIGIDPTGYRTCGTTTITLLSNSTIIINGAVKVYQGASILIGRNASLKIDDGVTVGDRAEIICMEKIELGRHSDLTWECQMTDFASHPVLDRISGELHPMTKPVFVGEYCWIGNRTTIMPGTRIPNRTIVASNSLLNKDYIQKGIKPYTLIGGIPAVMIRENIERIYK